LSKGLLVAPLVRAEDGDITYVLRIVFEMRGFPSVGLGSDLLLEGRAATGRHDGHVGVEEQRAARARGKPEWVKWGP
jgi:hypothetical protein